MNQTSATDTLSSKLKEEVALKEKLSREGGVLRGEVQGLRKELARKAEEVQAIRKDAANKIRHVGCDSDSDSDMTDIICYNL